MSNKTQNLTSRGGALWLTSPRGLMDESPGLYSEEQVAAWQLSLPRLAKAEVTDTNHYTILLGNGIEQVAQTVRQAVDLADASMQAKEQA